uniref:Uncharacterized protein n=1 Tax=Sphaerodactylus townsendi TaxID=933632 RepID=A0ACB8E7S8_9SAUR
MRAGNRTVPDGPRQPDSDRPPWVATALAAILIFTIVVDILGNLLVILSVYRNKKLRNAGEQRQKKRPAGVMCEEALSEINK